MTTLLDPARISDGGLVDRGALRAVSRGAFVPIDAWAGRVAVASSAAAYIGGDGGDLIVVRDAGSFAAGTHTSNSVVVEGFRVQDWPVDERCFVRRVVVVGPRVTVDLRGVLVWQPRCLSGVMRESVLAPAELASCARAVGGTALDRSSAAIGPRLGALVAALANSESTSAGFGRALALVEAARAVVGFGSGLTPSGDDAIVGLLAVLHSLGHDDAIESLSAVLAGLVSRTTIVGSHQLRRAMVGDFAEPIVAVLEALVLRSGGGARGPLGAVRTLLGVGATSGADTLLGMIAALEAFAGIDGLARARS